MNQSSSSRSSVSTLGLLGIAFVVLKLTNYINWSWWLVTLPFWGGIVVFLFGLILWIIYSALVHEKPKIIKKSRFEQKLKDAIKEQELRPK